MKNDKKLPFDPKVFLSKVGGGRTMPSYQKDQIVYAQGDPADSEIIANRIIAAAKNGERDFRPPLRASIKGLWHGRYVDAGR